MIKKILILFFLFFLNIFFIFGQLYNTTEIENSNNIYEFIKGVDKTLDMGFPNPIGVAIILIMFGVGFSIGLRNGELIHGMLSGCFISALSGLLLLPLNILSFEVYVVVIIISAVVVFFSILSKKI